MTNKKMRYKMMEFFAKDFNCNAEDFLSDRNKVISHNDPTAELFRMKCFGNAVVVNAHEKLCDWFNYFVSKYVGYRCFDGTQISLISRELAKYDCTVSCGQGALPDMAFIRKNAYSSHNMRIFKKNEIENFYKDEIYGSFYPNKEEWHMLDYEDDTEYIVAYYEQDIVAGFATADRCTDKIYEIGYETLPEYQQKGIATALTVEMTNLLLGMDIIPYAGFAWSHIASKNTVIKSGYVMAWSNMGTCDKDDWAIKLYRGEAE